MSLALVRVSVAAGVPGVVGMPSAVGALPATSSTVGVPAEGSPPLGVPSVGGAAPVLSCVGSAVGASGTAAVVGVFRAGEAALVGVLVAEGVPAGGRLPGSVVVVRPAEEAEVVDPADRSTLVVMVSRLPPVPVQCRFA